MESSDSHIFHISGFRPTMEEWMTKSLTLEDWESVFRSALAASEEQSKVTAAGMEAQ
jgi:hypothetical protein